MIHFCFNDCVPMGHTKHRLVEHLTATLTHFDSIKRKFPDNVDGIVTSKYPSDLMFNNLEFSLRDCIQMLSRELRIIAYSNFNKYPVDNFYDLTDVDGLLEREFSIVIDQVSYDGLNAKIVQENNGILFTLAVHIDLRRNEIEICDDKKHVHPVINQFGEQNNTDFITARIERDLIQRLGAFEKLCAIVGSCCFTNRFKKSFDTLTSASQQAIIRAIENAIKRKARTRFYPDDSLIKDVTPDSESEIKVFELRIFNPAAIRMYFFETPSIVYFGGIEGKPKKKVQDADILNAKSVIKELVITQTKQMCTE